ncbi:MAG: four helix bundle protein [Acidobacteriota bacterium]|nr:four helix bundle protein [Acidobacteriota bacterium]
MNDERGTSGAQYDLRLRTRAFALRIVKLYTSLPKAAEAQVLGKQLLRSGTSVGAHYHEATRARSNAEFISKLQGGLQELEETIYWLNLLIDSDIVKKKQLLGLCHEADELAAILVASIKTVKRRT